MPNLLTLFALVFALNLIPAFAPPTWMAMSWIGLSHPDARAWPVALVAATAATLGRLTLARGARALVRNRLFGEDARANVDAIKERLEGRRALTFGVFLTYAFSPLPSNLLFIAFGLTSLAWHVVAVPFFCGRLASYGFWLVVGAQASRHALGDGGARGYFGGYFVVSQVAVLLALYVFTKLDWRLLLSERRFRFRRPPLP